MPQTPNHVVVNHTRALPDVVKEAISARNQQIPSSKFQPTWVPVMWGAGGLRLETKKTWKVCI